MIFFTPTEKTLLKKLNTPAKVQDYLNSLKFNFETDGKDVIKSPVRVMREKSAHCMEGAVLAAYILSLHGYKPLILHLQTTKHDFDHVIAVFQKDGLWGAISKTNHAVLRYREAVYKDIRELVMSYFHEYFLNNNGQKTLRKYSEVLDLSKKDILKKIGKDWAVREDDLWEIDDELDRIKHYEIVPKKLSKKVYKNLRKADKIEIEAGKIEEYKRK
jgi:hypothetical protein